MLNNPGKDESLLPFEIAYSENRLASGELTVTQRVTVESLDRFRANLQSLVAGNAKTLPVLIYLDFRFEERANGAKIY